MTLQTAQHPHSSSYPAGIHTLHVQNYRVLQDVRFDNLRPLTVLVGPNGSGKSTLLDALRFLAECLRWGLRPAWERRGGARGLKSCGHVGPITIELHYRVAQSTPLLMYHLEADEQADGPIVVHEWLAQSSNGSSVPTRLLDLQSGRGTAITGEPDSQGATHKPIALAAPDALGISVLGQLAAYQHIAALRKFILNWLIADAAPSDPGILAKLGSRASLPRTSDGLATALPEQRLSRHSPTPPSLLAVESPEQSLYPHQMSEVAATCRAAADRAQLLMTTYSPVLLNSIRADEVWLLQRNAQGFAECMQASRSTRVNAFVEEGATLGALWLEGHLLIE